MDDLGELAARLGSIVTYDRRGDVAFLEDFEEGLWRWITQPDDGWEEATLTARWAINGRLSALLKTGGGAENTSGIWKAFRLVRLNRWGVEAKWTLGDSASAVDFYVYVCDGATRTTFRVAYNVPDARLILYDEDGAVQTVAEVDIHSTAYYDVHVLKVVVDPAAGKYQRVILNGGEYDISAYAGVPLASAAAPRLELVVAHTALGAYVDQISVDDIIITQNEP